jgi:hypothetical protein
MDTTENQRVVARIDASIEGIKEAIASLDNVHIDNRFVRDVGNGTQTLDIVVKGVLSSLWGFSDDLEEVTSILKEASDG